ncbi:hypothetical protein BGZ61DRAFT_234565 [Ilyonectria robusta]|uniref:uncharacterized protein n=1 Tax=Ilyonectria robusta TaxID=1079257 RepID=UPI001E8CF1B9|nr:uncharacterized protein BGZ61DRAFT_234565 [Ilyonectria robusta]KAH8699618.1 hypothetical protein BGZ61DRAFT_234565 [Ilyonectria robusta]
MLRGSLLLFLGQRSKGDIDKHPWFRLRRCGASHHRPCIRKPAKAGIMMTGCLRTAAGVNSSIVLLQRARCVADHRRGCDSPEPSSEMCRNVFATITPTVAYGKVSCQTVRPGTLTSLGQAQAQAQGLPEGCPSYAASSDSADLSPNCPSKGGRRAVRTRTNPRLEICRSILHLPPWVVLVTFLFCLVHACLRWLHAFSSLWGWLSGLGLGWAGLYSHRVCDVTPSTYYGCGYPRRLRLHARETLRPPLCLDGWYGSGFGFSSSHH